MDSNSDIAIIIGQRLRARRIQLGYSQDYTSERAELHPTYIGQLERGEKNATLISIEKVCRALDLPMEELFANLVGSSSPRRTAQKCYDLIISQPLKDQKKLYDILEDVIQYKET